MAAPSASTSCGADSSPIPVVRTTSRTPGSPLATTGVPHSIASTWTSPNDSVEFTLATTRQSSALKKAGISATGSSGPRKRHRSPRRSNAGLSLSRYRSSPRMFSYGPAKRTCKSGKRRWSTGSASSSMSTPFSAAKRAAIPIVGRVVPSERTSPCRRRKSATASGSGRAITTGGGITSTFSRNRRRSSTLSA
jgi:hypothetical protein